MGEQIERVILVGVSAKQERGSEELLKASLDELAELIQTAGAVEVGRLTQNVDGNHPGTYIGKGKIEELKIRDTKLDKFLNKLSMRFYTKYVFNRTKKKTILFWLVPLCISLFLYPPYLNKLKGVVSK